MKIIKGFVMREIAGKSVVVGEGLKQIDFNKLISLNETAAYLWKEVEGKDFNAGTLAELLTSHYNVDEVTARKDAEDIVRDWHATGLIED